jgi:hypothetical protein
MELFIKITPDEKSVIVNALTVYRSYIHREMQLNSKAGHDDIGEILNATEITLLGMLNVLNKE